MSTTQSSRGGNGGKNTQSASPKPAASTPKGKQRSSPRLRSSATASTLTPDPKPPLQKNDDTPVTGNTSSPDFEMEENETVKSSEKPPEQLSTFKSVLIENIDAPITDSDNISTFMLLKKLHDSKSTSTADDIQDDITVTQDNSSSIADFPNSVKMTMMIKLPGKKEGCKDDDAPTVAIKRINAMLKALSNKLPCRVGPWTLNTPTTKLTAKDLIKTLPVDIDFVESFISGYNRFISPGKIAYVRIHVFYSNLTNLAEIQAVTATFKKPREQFLEVAHSNASFPVHIGTLTGSVRAMAESNDFHEVMKAKFKLSELGLWFTQPRSGKNGAFDSNKFTVHIEIDRKDLPKRIKMEQYFNRSSKSLDSSFFGTPMILTPAFDYSLDDSTKANLENHARKQASLGKSLRSTTISGVQLNNWSSRAKTSTLLRDLMEVESIVVKKVIKGNKAATFRGRVFYAIIPDRTSNCVTFIFTKASFLEGRSIARGLPLFIRDYFKLDPAFFCNSEALTSALEGSWDFATRKFLSADEKIECEHLDMMEAEANAEAEEFISKDQQAAMALDNDDVSTETRLTKGDAVPPSVNDDVSEMTGSTRESKAQAYAEKATRAVAAQYSDTITNMRSDLGDKDDKIAQLELMLKKFKNQSDDAIDSFTSDSPESKDENSSKKRKGSQVQDNPKQATDETSSHRDDMSL